jgi:hypothetical protein
VVFASLLLLIDRIIDLVKLRQTDKQQLFKEIVEPLFLQLQPVVDDYLTLFRAASNHFEANGRTRSAMDEAMAEFRKNREKMLHVRRQIDEMAKQIEAAVEDQRVNDFIGKVRVLFHSPTRNERPRMSNSKAVVDFYDYVVRARLNAILVAEYLQDTQQNLINAWMALTQSYASLRIHCMAPARYRKLASE